MLKLITNESGEVEAETQAREDMAQDRPNDRAVQVFRDQMQNHGNPTVATIAAMDAWLFQTPTRKGAQ